MSHSPVDQSRRGFLSGSLLTREGKKQVQQRVKRLGLMPPGLGPISSTENCANCSGFCAKKCPQKIIRLHPDKHQLKGQPYLDFSRNGCTFCSECYAVCPEKIDHEPGQFSLGKAHLNQQKCYAWLGIICMSCISVCPEQLFTFDKSRKPSIQLDACTGCGCCIKICPATAISIMPDIEA